MATISLTGCRRWPVLLSYSATSALNAFTSLNFAGAEQITGQLFHIGDGAVTSEVTSFYTWYMFGVALSVLVGGSYAGSHNWTVTFLGTAMTTGGAWVRVLACEYQNAQLCILSSVILGVGAGFILSNMTQIVELWFPPSSQTVAVSVASLSNYAGWALGAILAPCLATDIENLKAFMRCQGYTSVALLLLFFLVYRSYPRRARAATRVDSHGGWWAALRAIIQNGQVLMQTFCFAVSIGISFTIPALLSDVFQDLIHVRSSAESGVVSGIFILSGVIGGMVVGSCLDESQYLGRIIKPMLAAGVFGLLAVCCVCDAIHLSMWSGADHGAGRTWAVIILVALMIWCGVAIIGVLPLMLEQLAASAFPLDSGYSTSCVELFALMISIGVTQVSALLEGEGLWLCLAALAAASLVFFPLFKPRLHCEEQSGGCLSSHS